MKYGRRPFFAVLGRDSFFPTLKAREREREPKKQFNQFKKASFFLVKNKNFDQLTKSEREVKWIFTITKGVTAITKGVTTW